jgi:uncharacterized membrane protein
MKFLRFAVVGLCLLGVAFCVNALGRLAGLSPPSKLPPYPAWTAIHFATAIAFVVLLPLQLWPAFRNTRPAAHRALGRVGVGVGAVMGVSGLAIVLFVDGRPVSERIFMSVFLAVWSLFLGLGVRAALARDIPTHRAWMARMTATTLTPLTQRLIFPVFAVGFGIDGLATFWQLFVSAAWIGWGLNLAVAEVWLRARPAARQTLAAAAGVS